MAKATDEAQETGAVGGGGGGGGLRLIDYIPISISKLDVPPLQDRKQQQQQQQERRFLEFLKHLLELSKKWAMDPANAAVIVWLLAVGAGLLLLLLLVSGVLNRAIPESSVRKNWAEIVNQILNALFTIMCLYQHPKLFHHLLLLLRWTPKDAGELRTIYCNNAGGRPWERVHLHVVLFLLHCTCLAQYALCGLYWGYNRTDRPDTAVTACVVASTAAPVLAAAYVFLGPLGRKQGDNQAEEEGRSERSVSVAEHLGVEEIEEREVKLAFDTSVRLNSIVMYSHV